MFAVPKAMLTIDERGLVLGGHTVLVEASRHGRFTFTESLTRCGRVLEAAYPGKSAAMEDVQQRIAEALVKWDQGQHSVARIRLIHIGLPEPDDADGTLANRLRKVVEDYDRQAAAKFNPHWVTQPRVPRGEHGGGEFGTMGGGVIPVAAHTGKPEHGHESKHEPFNPCADRDAVGFVKQHQAEAAAIAGVYSVPTSYVLGLSARETGYGGKGSFISHNAFFNMEGAYDDGDEPSPEDIKDIPYATGAIPAKEVNQRTGQRSWVYTYSSFTEAAKSFFAKYGAFVRGSKSPEEFLKRLKDGGFNSGKHFMDTAVLKMVERRLKCPD